MNGIGVASYIPTDRIRRTYPVYHILTKEEIQGLFRAIDDYTPSRPSMDTARMASEYGVIFRLILSTGLRRTEAATIRVQDIDWAVHSIAIYNAKGKKDRLVYMSEDMAMICREYLNNLQRMIGFESFWLFPGVDSSKHVSPGSLTILFRRLWLSTSFAASSEKNPTIHSLRHVYVVFRMNIWIEQGVDLNVMMTYLSRHLGHKTPKETFYYYHQVSEAFKAICLRDTVAPAVLPEVRIK